MKHSLIIIVFFIVFISCKGIEARRPKQHVTTNFYKEVLKKNKELNKIEQKKISYLISKDTVNVYKTSSNGFWYTYIKKDTLNTVTPKLDDTVTLSFNITSLNDDVIYEQQEVTYKVDKEDFIPGLQEGVKLMKEGESVLFIIPSYIAYGVTGDGNKIGMSTPIKSTLKLIQINQ